MNPCLPAGRPPSVSARLRFATASKTEKFSLHFFIRPPPNFFQLRKLKFFCFVFLLREELRKRFHPTARLLGQSLSRIIPKGFVRGPQIFFGGGKLLFSCSCPTPPNATGNIKELPIKLSITQKSAGVS